METSSSPLTSFGKLLQRYLAVLLCLFGVGLLAVLLVRAFGSTYTYHTAIVFFKTFAQPEFLVYLLVGFAAQMIDGALGMAYGISSSSFLMSVGVPPAVASASVHLAEVMTTGISGLSHWKLGNVDKKLFKKLIIPGMVGAGLGAYGLTSFQGETIKPYVAAYLLIMGVIIILKAFRKVTIFRAPQKIGWLALLGGFVDASGGGGWGPVVTSTLVGTGNHPRSTIGTVNAVEFGVTLVASGVFTLLVGVDSWLVVAGLMVGGALAAPLGAYVCQKINLRLAMGLVGTIIILLSLNTLITIFRGQ